MGNTPSADDPRNISSQPFSEVPSLDDPDNVFYTPSDNYRHSFPGARPPSHQAIDNLDGEFSTPREQQRQSLQLTKSQLSNEEPFHDPTLPDQSTNPFIGSSLLSNEELMQNSHPSDVPPRAPQPQRPLVSHLQALDISASGDNKRSKWRLRSDSVSDAGSSIDSSSVFNDDVRSYRRKSILVQGLQPEGNPSPYSNGPNQQGTPTIINWSQGGNNVYVTGTFNGWKHKIKLVKSTHDFTAVLNLPPGTHRLKFVVDEEWKCSNELETATDPDGNLVNWIEVADGEEDLEEGINISDEMTLSSTPPGTYTSEIPSYLLAYQTTPESPSIPVPSSPTTPPEMPPEPPVLPPHLEKVLLNMQGVSEDDNSVLPVPNHVTLNHLYACSIRDGVMAVGGTARYRKKYITTMYYKPVSR